MGDLNVEVATKKKPGRPKKPTGENRLHVSLPDSLIDRIQELQIQSHSSSISEVIKKALTLYAAALEEHKAGGRVCFRRDGEDRQLVLFL